MRPNRFRLGRWGACIVCALILTALSPVTAHAAVRWSGVLRTADGTPVPGASLQLRNADGFDNETTAADGSFQLDATPGTATLSASFQHLPSALRLPGSVGFSASISLLSDLQQDMTLPATVAVTAHVVDSQGAPVAGASVSGSGEDVPLQSFMLAPGISAQFGGDYMEGGTTDSSGQYVGYVFPRTFAAINAYINVGNITWQTSASNIDATHDTTVNLTLPFVLDVTPPAISCGVTDGLWHAANVSIMCSAADSGSGLADPTQANITLSTQVPAGMETTSASTVTMQICNNAGYCATAGPIGANKIDRRGPTIAIATPADGAAYSRRGKAEVVSFSCADGGSGVTSCTGSLANRSALPKTLGIHTFTVTATDNVGNTSVVTDTYSVVR